jgi:hypothetical protein
MAKHFKINDQNLMLRDKPGAEEGAIPQPGWPGRGIIVGDTVHE